ncbi:MAG: hypothetical protein ACJAVO_001925 [Parvibaculaceae bacterium]|jgi:hypothetical protein
MREKWRSNKPLRVFEQFAKLIWPGIVRRNEIGSHRARDRSFSCLLHLLLQLMPPLAAECSK